MPIKKEFPLTRTRIAWGQPLNPLPLLERTAFGEFGEEMRRRRVLKHTYLPEE
jgi:hypothetical protein